MKRSHPNLYKIIQLLNDKEYHDDNSLGEALDISRTAVWKIIKKLEAYNVPLVSEKKKGYALQEPLSLLDKTKLKHVLKHKKLSIDLFESLGSTNDYLKNFCNEQKIRICLAEQQTAGRGRFNRSWHSPFGQNLYFSVLYPFNKDISGLGGVSLITGLSVVHTLNELYDLPEKVAIKWPNDVIYAHKKLAGILVDIQVETDNLCHAIIGIGINVNTTESKEISQPWTSLKKITHQHHDRNLLAAKLINNLLNYLQQFIELGLASFIKEWEKYDMLFKQVITLQTGRQQYQGEGLGINTQGHLLIKRDDTNTIQAFSAGETTILKR